MRRSSSIPFVPEFGSPIELKRMVRHEWVESAAPFDGQGREGDFLGTSISSRNISTAFFLIVLTVIIFLGRSAHLQLLEGRGFAVASAAQKERTEIIAARRGILFDTKGRVLVTNTPRFVLEIESAQLPRDRDERIRVIARASTLAKQSEEEISTALARHRYSEPLIIRDAIPYPEALRVMVEAETLPGVAVSLRYARNYATKEAMSLSPILGYMGPITEAEYRSAQGAYRLSDRIGREGLEFSYESVLRGQNGKKHIEIDALGREKRVIFQDEARDGTSLTLTIDRDIQERSERALREQMKEFGATRGVVIVSDPRNGAIRAMVSLPTYDNNEFAYGISPAVYSALIHDPNLPLFNRAIQGEYPSGSTIKPLVAAAALQEGIVTPETSILSTGGLRIARWYFPDWLVGGHGRTNLVKALAESVNTYFYLIGGGADPFVGLGIERLAAAFTRFGLGSQTGIDLPGEAAGFIPSPAWKESRTGEPWYIGDTYHVAIGQGDILVTPLQVHEFTAYFANNGSFQRPHLVERTEKGAENNDLRSGIVDQPHVEAVRAGLRKAVSDGSARRLSLLPVSAAGKTGTAQWSTTKNPHAWFTGWAPYENPAVLVTVLIEEGGEGSTSATRVAYDIFSWYFQGQRASSVDNQ